MMDAYDERTREGRLRGRAVEMTTESEKEGHYLIPVFGSAEGMTPIAPFEGDES